MRLLMADFMVTAQVSSPRNAPQHMLSEHYSFAVAALVHIVASFRGVAWSLLLRWNIGMYTLQWSCVDG
eukprot:6173734-Pleurochrysis_carterae.AAC.1